MNSKLIRTLTLICLILMSIITLEWFYAQQAQKQLLSSIRAKPQQTINNEMPHIDLNQQPEASYADVVNRPLFIQGRRAVAEKFAHIAGADNELDWLLSGVYSSKKGLMALLTRKVLQTPDALPNNNKPMDNYRKVIVGADLDGWKVEQIYPDKILLVRGFIKKELPLRKPKIKAVQEQNAMPFNSGREMRMPPMPNSQTEPQPEPTDNPSNNNHAHTQ